MTREVPATGVLEGTRVLDFGRYIAGPYCAGVLAQLGADVIRVERPDGGEDRYLAPVTDSGEGALFLQVNRNKRGLALDPTTPAGREIVNRLVARADVVVANLPPASFQAMGLDYEALKPDIILTAITAFGSEGPESERVDFDGIAQAMSGSMYLSGQRDDPTKAYVPFVDFGTALAAAVGTLAALMRRRQTGQEQRVEASLLATSLTYANAALIEQAVLGLDRVASGNRGQLFGPADRFRTKDGFILVQVVGQPLFERWVALIKEPEWLQDARFSTDAGRGDHGEALSERMAAWCRERTTRDALDALAEARIPAGPVLAARECLDHPQVGALGLLEPTDYPGLARTAPVATLPVRLSEGSAAQAGRAPTLGEHTAGILAELGYEAAQVEALRRSRVIEA